MSRDKQLIVIPYVSDEAQGEELTLAVEGWRRHFKHPHHILIVGDRHPVCDTGDDIEWMGCPRLRKEDYPGQYLPHIDIAHKLAEVYRLIEAGWKWQFARDGFIKSSDDIYALRDFTLEDITMIKANTSIMGGSLNALNGWLRDEAKTRIALASEGVNGMGYVCHLPIRYDWHKVMTLFYYYGMERESYILEDIYFNVFARKEPREVWNNDIINRYRLRVTDDTLTYDNLCELDRLYSPIWAYNGTAGYYGDFMKFLKEKIWTGTYLR